MSDRPTAGTVEQRALDDSPQVDGRRLRGRIPYGVESRDLGGFVEVIERGALRDADLSGLIATREHERTALLGRHPTTLTVEDRDDGFHWSVELPQSPTGEDVRIALERGDLRSTSWRMVVAKDRWEGNTRHVERIAELRDVTVTAAPAYGDHAAAELRAEPEPKPAPQEPERPDTEPQEAQVPDEPEGGGLRVEDRSQHTEPEHTIEDRVMDAIRSVNKGEARSLNLTTAGPIAPAEQGSFVWDRLRAASVMLASGVRVLTTDRQKIEWPRILADVQPDWYSEEETISAGDPTFGTLTATPKKLAHRVEASNEAIDDSEPSLVEVVTGHLTAMLALKLDASMLVGNPTANPDSIRGLKFTSGIQTIDLGANGSALTNYDAIVRAVGMLRSANVTGPLAAVAHPRDVQALSLLKEATGSQLQLAAPTDLPPVYTTTQLPINETKGTSSNASSIYVFAPHELVLVRRQDATIELDRSRLFDKDMSELRGKLRCDFIVPNPVAVVRIEGIVPA